MVQNGKLAASAPAADSALNKVDLPTFGNPTIPILMVTTWTPLPAHGFHGARRAGPCHSHPEVSIVAAPRLPHARRFGHSPSRGAHRASPLPHRPLPSDARSHARRRRARTATRPRLVGAGVGEIR